MWFSISHHHQVNFHPNFQKKWVLVKSISFKVSVFKPPSIKWQFWTNLFFQSDVFALRPTFCRKKCKWIKSSGGFRWNLASQKVFTQWFIRIQCVLCAPGNFFSKMQHLVKNHQPSNICKSKKKKTQVRKQQWKFEGFFERNLNPLIFIRFRCYQAHRVWRMPLYIFKTTHEPSHSLDRTRIVVVCWKLTNLSTITRTIKVSLKDGFLDHDLRQIWSKTVNQMI